MSCSVRHGTLVLAVASLLMAAPGSASAQVERFALIVGNNSGLPHETELRYAERDASKVHTTLRDIGGFAPLNMLLLQGEDAQTLRRSLIDLNARLREARSRAGAQIVLFVYYSGHADATDLHLGSSRLSIAELSQLVRGSAADFRLLVLDACRSGVLTRSKGGRQTQPFDIPQQGELAGEGLAFLTASADDELAQESDELRGSFFTHALVSGLLGAADRDGDGNVLLEEAYHYAYDSTLRASSRSATGLQHPTFFYDLRGHGRLVLTRPFARGQGRGWLALPANATYLVFHGGPDGQVAAEVAAEDEVRLLSLRPGRYFVRGRDPAHVLEGEAVVEDSRTTRVDADALERIEYAHLVRKGHAALPAVHAIELLGYARAPLPNGGTPCYGALAGYRLDTEHVAWAVRAGFCNSTLEASKLRAQSNEFDLGLRVVRAFDLSARLAIDAGVGLSAVYLEQYFEPAERAPARRSFAGFAELMLGASFAIAGASYATLDVALQGYALPMFNARTRTNELKAALTGRLAIGAGTRF